MSWWPKKTTLNSNKGAFSMKPCKWSSIKLRKRMLNWNRRFMKRLRALKRQLRVMKKGLRFLRAESWYKKETKRSTFCHLQDRTKIKELKVTSWKTYLRQYHLQTIRLIEREQTVVICCFSITKLRVWVVTQWWATDLPTWFPPLLTETSSLTLKSQE